MSIAANIARLRKERGMTQEALAEVIGVSPQTVSKWENSTTYPDVTLLPVIADVFGVTVDALYGREDLQRAVSAEEAIEQVIERARECFVGVCYEPERDRSFADELAQYRKVMMLDERHRSVIESGQDVLYLREKRGVMALRRPEDGWNTLFSDDAAARLLQVLADADFRRAMQVILKRRMLTFTLSSLMKAAGAEDALQLEACLRESGLFARRELMIDEAPLVYWELCMGEQRLFLLYAVMAYAAEAVHYDAVHYCFIGNSQYFTP